MGTKKTASKKPAQTKLQRELQAQYAKELKRINQSMRRLTKRGYEVHREDILPQKPQKLTKKFIDKMKAITIDEVYKHSTYYSTVGKTITGEERRKQERSISAKRGAATKKTGVSHAKVAPTQGKYAPIPQEKQSVQEQIIHEADIIIVNFRSLLKEFESRINAEWSLNLINRHRETRNNISGFLDSAILKDGKAKVALRIKRNWQRIQQILQVVLYSSGSDYAQYDKDRTISSMIYEIRNILSMDRDNTLPFHAPEEERDAIRAAIPEWEVLWELGAGTE